MRYTNPYTKALNWQKAWFFLDNDVQRIMVAGITSTSGKPVYSVLDQKRRSGAVYINGSLASQLSLTTVHARSLWHDKVGYTFESPNDSRLSVQVANKTGTWSAIGTSGQPQATVDLFAAWIVHDNITAPVAYTAFPATDLATFQSKSTAPSVRTARNDVHGSAVYDPAHHTAAAVFWEHAGGSISVENTTCATCALMLSANANVIVIYQVNSGNLTIADPGQSLATVTVSISITSGGSWKNQSITITLPAGPGGLAGSSTTVRLI
jgi:hypothetical protein